MTLGDAVPQAWVEVEPGSSGSDVVFICGELDLATAPAVRNEIEAAMGPRQRFLMLDLGKLEFMDSSGIALLIQLANRLERVEIRNPSPSVRRVIEITGLNALFGLDQ
jgi:anti-sigma B factor antagonist